MIQKYINKPMLYIYIYGTSRMNKIQVVYDKGLKGICYMSER